MNYMNAMDAVKRGVDTISILPSDQGLRTISQYVLYYSTECYKVSKNGYEERESGREGHHDHGDMDTSPGCAPTEIDPESSVKVVESDPDPYNFFWWPDNQLGLDEYMDPAMELSPPVNVSPSPETWAKNDKPADVCFVYYVYFGQHVDGSNPCPY